MPAPVKTKKLYRSTQDRMVAGVIGGLAEYYQSDSSLFRLIWVLITVFTGFFPGLLIYLAAIFIIPIPANDGTLPS